MVGTVKDWEGLKAIRHCGCGSNKFVHDRQCLVCESCGEKYKGGGMSGGMEEMAALQKQEGGAHYKQMAIQPIEYIIANGMDYLSGNIVKYASRHKEKGGAEDIRKIKHYCDFILESVYGVSK